MKDNFILSEKTLDNELEKWFNKWNRKIVTGRCLVELKDINKEFIRRLKKEIQLEEFQDIIVKEIIDKLAGEKLK